MEISDQLRCLFSAQVEERDGSYVVEVPKREVRTGSLAAGDTYRVALVPSPSSGGDDEGGDAGDATRAERGDRSNGDRSGRSPPVEEGEERTVEIEDIGEQGDGITRVERGFVVIVPDTDQGERVTVEITDVRENVAFAEVVERRSYYE
ncbi:TRAM domain-containing protein [Halosimplex pelagicum]|uniref:TRAM domain-containing protein n=1 Tax=Halosimplex pelagicum TaxID=869886 RepID=A0A7D5T872_9EURY|nr:TRAM domain-containing protein [Halosimplex pelagicum]QLH84648.1 TRAM domain-containing protein [Halosimplex pelagicum]